MLFSYQQVYVMTNLGQAHALNCRLLVGEQDVKSMFIGVVVLQGELR
jgi:hypothetical protein